MLTRSKTSYDKQLTATHWRLLRYHVCYRLFIITIFFVSLFIESEQFVLFEKSYRSFHIALVGAYVLALLFSLWVLSFYTKHFNKQLTIHMLADTLLLVLLVHTGGKLDGGLGVLFLSSLAGAGLVGEGRLVLFYAAIASIGVLFEALFTSSSTKTGFKMDDVFQTGLFCLGFFVVAICAKLLARRVIANEELARKRGEALRNQVLINQSVIEEMQDGVLVLDRDGTIKQYNPCAGQMLGIDKGMGMRLVYYSAELAESFQRWCEEPVSQFVQVAITKIGIPLRARFVLVGGNRDVLALLEDVGSLQEQARQLKLAALGRLTANIAHEIRNPLSAISHAGELLKEDVTDKSSERLINIMLDNTKRVEYIVKNVLELGRRDKVHPERIDLRQALPSLIKEFVDKENIAAETIVCDISGEGGLLFDPFHFYQVITNLMGNALRHCNDKVGNITLQVQDGRRGWVKLHVIDDGPGISAEYREQIFEPFFTTHSHGTGLGLYIARELCEANNARIELIDSVSGADFCITGRSSE